MKNKLFFCFLVGLFLCCPNEGFSQCASIYEQAMSYMKKGSYKTAITYFKNAKACDQNLTAKCDLKIKECQSLISRKNHSGNKTEKLEKKSPITVDKTQLEFSAASTASQNVKISSSAEWTASSNEKWCKPVKIDDKKLSITCDINSTVKKRTAELIVGNGSTSQKIEVIQQGVESKIKFKENRIKISHKGDIRVLEVECNTEFRVLEKPEWVEIVSMNQGQIVIKVDGHDKGREDEVFSVITQDGKVSSLIIEQGKKFIRNPFK